VNRQIIFIVSAAARAALTNRLRWSQLRVPGFCYFYSSLL